MHTTESKWLPNLPIGNTSQGRSGDLLSSFSILSWLQVGPASGRHSEAIYTSWRFLVVMAVSLLRRWHSIAPFLLSSLTPFLLLLPRCFLSLSRNGINVLFRAEHRWSFIIRNHGSSPKRGCLRWVFYCCDKDHDQK